MESAMQLNKDMIIDTIQSNIETDRISGPQLDRWCRLQAMRKRTIVQSRRRVYTQTEPSLDMGIIEGQHDSLPTQVTKSDQKIVQYKREDEQQKLVEINSKLISMIIKKKGPHSTSLIDKFSSLQEVFGNKETKAKVKLNFTKIRECNSQDRGKVSSQLLSYEQLENDRLKEFREYKIEYHQSNEQLLAVRKKLSDTSQSRAESLRKILELQNDRLRQTQLLNLIQQSLQIAKQGSSSVTRSSLSPVVVQMIYEMDSSKTIHEKLHQLYKDIHSKIENIDRQIEQQNTLVYETEIQLHKIKNQIKLKENESNSFKNYVQQLRDELLQLCANDAKEYEIDPRQKRLSITHHIMLFWKFGEEFDMNIIPHFITQSQKERLLQELSLLIFEKDQQSYSINVQQIILIRNELIKLFSSYNSLRNKSFLEVSQFYKQSINLIKQQIMKDIDIEAKQVTRIENFELIQKQLFTIFGSEASVLSYSITGFNQKETLKKLNKNITHEIPSPIMRKVKSVARALSYSQRIN